MHSYYCNTANILKIISSYEFNYQFIATAKNPALLLKHGAAYLTTINIKSSKKRQ
jgi:hypothetical protein